MSTIVVKNFPDELHGLLKQRAERNHRSMNKEVVHLITAGLATEAAQPLPAEAKPVPDGREALRAALVKQPDGSYVNVLGIDDEGFFDALDEIRARPRSPSLDHLFDDAP